MLPDFFDWTLSEWIAFGGLIAGFMGVLAIQFGFYFKLAFLKSQKENIQEKPVSILLSVRNEEERIGKLLFQLLDQNYQDYEIVVIDNFSEDNTLTIVGAMARKYPRIKFSSLSQELRFSEKMAVNLALKAAHFDWVIFLSPDTVEITPDFLKKINNEITDGQTLALNYLNYFPQKGLYHKLCRIERFYSFLTSAAYSLSGINLFFQQNNVLFPKQFYFESAGFKGRMNDDFANMELLFNNGNRHKVIVSADPDTHLRETAGLGRTDFADLVKKRIQIKKNLSLNKRLILGLEDFASILLIAGLAGILILEIQYWFIFIIPVIVVLGLHVFIMKSFQNRLKEKKIFLSSFAYLFGRPVISGFYRIILAIQMRRNKWI